MGFSSKIRAVLFDLHGTLAYVEEEVTDLEISDYLVLRGYEISPQQLRAAWAFVSFVDYPKYGYKNWNSYLSRIFWRLKTKVDEETLRSVCKLLEDRPYELYDDAASAVVEAKANGLKTAIVTTIALFKFQKAIEPIREHFDLIMTGYEAGCDKSNPKMYRTVLGALEAKPEETLMIGDDFQLDVLLPKRLGMKAVLLDRSGTATCENMSVDAIVYNLSDAMEIIINRFCGK